MSDKNTIDHLGRVEALQGDLATVIINSESACASCHAKGACSAADQTEKVLSIHVGRLTVSRGEMVRVLISKRTGLKAVAVGYVYPFLLLMAILILLTAIGLSELQAGAWSLFSLLPYYLTVYLFRQKISNAFTFRLEKIT